MTWLDGKKTYFVMGIAIAYALVQGWSGAIDSNTAVQTILAALGLGGMRSAMKR